MTTKETTEKQQVEEVRSIEQLINTPIPYVEMNEKELELVIKYKADVEFQNLKNNYEYGLQHYALLQQANRHANACDESNEVLFSLVEQAKLNNELSKDLFKDLEIDEKK